MSKKKHYPIRIPRYAPGIRAQELRTGAGRSWWAKRWMQAMERMKLGSRLGRGRNYALSGQVLKMTIAGPQVDAQVVGTRAEPYAVGISFRTPGDEARARIVSHLRREPMLIARLLVDDLPTEVEMLFREEGLDLFPGGKLAQRKYDVTTSCSCPDYANPCKHSSAVLMILGEEVARRPLTLLELRSITLEELLNED